MPGRPSSTWAIESPTGCTKQLISVADRAVPAADWMRPAGMKPCSSASRKRGFPKGVLVGGFGLAKARALHTVHVPDGGSSPLAYFSASTSSLMAWGGNARTVALGARFDEVGSVTMGIPCAFGGCGVGRDTLRQRLWRQSCGLSVVRRRRARCCRSGHRRGRVVGCSPIAVAARRCGLSVEHEQRQLAAGEHRLGLRAEQEFAEGAATVGHHDDHVAAL